MQKSPRRLVISIFNGNVRPRVGFSGRPFLAASAAILLLAFAGCQTPQPPPPQPPPPDPRTEQLVAAVRQTSANLLSPTVAPQGGAVPGPALGAASPVAAGRDATNAPGDSLQLEEGDSLQISFPGAPSLNRTVSIRRDGKISLDMIGDIQAAGMTPKQLESVLLDKYGPQLVVKEVNVTVISSAFIVYVTGAVSRPGKLASDRALTPLQAVIEAGIDSSKSNLKSVRVIRTDDRGRTERFKLNLARILDGKQFEPFTLKPFDVIVVPERFTWF